jgi:hypothetical protein
MLNLPRIAYYLLTTLPTLFWVTWIGVVLILAGIVLEMYFGRMGLVPMLFGYVIGLVLPFVAAITEGQSLITNRRLWLVPGLRLRVGIALLLLAVIVSGAPPLATAIYLPSKFDSLLGLRLFAISSAGVWIILRLAAGMRVATTFVVLMACLVLPRYARGFMTALWFDSTVTLVLFGVACAGWLYGLYRLAVRPFAPAQRVMSPTKVPRQASFQRPEHLEPAEYSMLGRSARWPARLLFVPLGLSLSLLGCLLLWLPFGYLASSRQSAPPWQLLVGTAPFLALFIALGFSLQSSELAARGRLIWLRHGGDRRSLWRLTETLVLVDMLGAILFVVLMSLAVAAVQLVDALPPVSFIQIGMSSMLLLTYVNLAGRVAAWSEVAIVLADVFFAVVIGVAFLSNSIPDALVTLIAIVLSLVVRLIALREFTAIDWHRVRPRSIVRIPYYWSQR